MKLSVVLATRNEEKNIARCLSSVKDIADEIVVMDEHSNDKTRDIAKSFGALVYEVDHEPIFHVTKQKAIDKAKGEWILQMDADEAVSPALAKEIKEVIGMTYEQIKKRRPRNGKAWQLFQRHQKLIEDREGKLGKDTGEVVAFFIPRRNMFLGKELIHAGGYPDGVIRLIKRGKAHLPSKSVHEQMIINGEVAWLFENLEHYDSPTLKRYFERMNRYTDLHAQELAKTRTGKNAFQFLNYTIFKPTVFFLKLYIRHKGFQDGLRGFMWSALSSMHFPLAYYKYLTDHK